MKNQHKFQNLAFLFVIICVTLLFQGCSVDSSGPPPGVTIRDKAVFLGSFAGAPFADDFRARFTRQIGTVESDTKTVVISGEYANTAILQGAVAGAYQAGAVIVLVSPTGTQLSLITSAINHAPALAPNTGSEPLCDMYVFNKFDDHHILMADTITYAAPEDITVTHVTLTGVDEAHPDGTGRTETTETVPSMSLGNVAVADWNPLLDTMVMWIDAHNNGEKGQSRRTARSAADPNDVTNLMTAQMVTITYNGGSSYTLANSNITCNSIAVTDQYYIWAVYDRTNQQEYYIIREDITIPNQNLGYRQNYGTGSNYYNTGFYLNQFNSNHVPKKNGAQLTLNSQVYGVSQSPTTENGAQTVTTGTNESWASSFGFNGENLTGNITSTIGYSSSTAHTIKDFSVVNDYGAAGNIGTANTAWTYHIQNEPPFHSAPWNHAETPSVGGAPDLAIHTANFTNEWIWRMPTGRDVTDTYSMQVRGQVCYAYSWVQGKPAWEYYYGRAEDGPLFDNTVNLTPPPRNLSSFTITNNSSDYISEIKVWKPATATNRAADYTFSSASGGGWTIPPGGATPAAWALPYGNGYKVQVKAGNNYWHSMDGGFNIDVTNGLHVYIGSGSPNFVAGSF